MDLGLTESVTEFLTLSTKPKEMKNKTNPDNHNHLGSS